MFDVKTVSMEWGGKTLTLETGRIARQADGAVLATYGETVVLCAVTAAKSVKEGQDFFPLTVHYQEKFFAAGRIPGGFFKRERGATQGYCFQDGKFRAYVYVKGKYVHAGTYSTAVEARSAHLSLKARLEAEREQAA